MGWLGGGSGLGHGEDDVAAASGAQTAHGAPSRAPSTRRSGYEPRCASLRCERSVGPTGRPEPRWPGPLAPTQRGSGCRPGTVLEALAASGAAASADAASSVECSITVADNGASTRPTALNDGWIGATSSRLVRGRFVQPARPDVRSSFSPLGLRRRGSGRCDSTESRTPAQPEQPRRPACRYWPAAGLLGLEGTRRQEPPRPRRVECLEAIS